MLLSKFVFNFHNSDLKIFSHSAVIYKLVSYTLFPSHSSIRPTACSDTHRPHKLIQLQRNMGKPQISRRLIAGCGAKAMIRGGKGCTELHIKDDTSSLTSLTSSLDLPLC